MLHSFISSAYMTDINLFDSTHSTPLPTGFTFFGDNNRPKLRILYTAQLKRDDNKQIIIYLRLKGNESTLNFQPIPYFNDSKDEQFLQSIKTTAGFINFSGFFDIELKEIQNSVIKEFEISIEENSNQVDIKEVSFLVIPNKGVDNE